VNTSKPATSRPHPRTFDSDARAIPSVDVSNVLSKEKKQQVIVSELVGWSLRRVQRATGVRRETDGAYLKSAGIAVRAPAERSGRRRQNRHPSDHQLAAGKTGHRRRGDHRSHTRQTRHRDHQRSGCRKSGYPGDHRLWRRVGRPRDIVARPNSRSLSHLQGLRSVRQAHPHPSLEARVVIETAPGEECHVDYGDGPMVRDAATGKYRRTRLFVMTLGYSRKSVRLLVPHSSARVWAELHEKAFRRLTGVTRVVVLDNLREGVLAPDVYDPALNPLYRDVLRHYGRGAALPHRGSRSKG